MVLPALLLNQLLGQGIARREEHGSRDALGQEGARGQLHLVPRSRSAAALFTAANAIQIPENQQWEAYHRSILAVKSDKASWKCVMENWD